VSRDHEGFPYGVAPLAEPNTDSLFVTAGANLSQFIRLQARMRRWRVHFGWRGSTKAQSSVESLHSEFAACRVSDLPLRVSNLNSDPVIYDSPATNLAFRYWHDTGHVIFGLSFNTGDELELADHHLEALRAEGYGHQTVEHQLLHADTVGQALFTMRTGQFVGNQVRFDTNCVLFGVEEAVTQELAALQAPSLCRKPHHDILV